jgi:hypothetical protein
MKIIPFLPAASPGDTSSPNKPKNSTNDFGTFLEKSMEKLPPRDKIGLENVLANECAPVEDLAQAALLLTRVISQIGLKSPGELNKVHNLDGLLCF